MRVQVVMPQMGESIVEGTIVAWLKQVGDTVRRDEEIFTISTDKVDAEIPSPSDGVLVELLAAVGDKIEVGKPVGWIETDPGTAKSGGEKKSPAAKAAAAAKSEVAAPPAAAASASSPASGAPRTGGRGSASPAVATARSTARPKSGPMLQPAARRDATKAPAQAPAPRSAAPSATKALRATAPPSAPAASAAASISTPPAAGEEAEELRARRSTPLVRRIAADHGISSLYGIPGSGIGGRVTRRDILTFIESGAAAPMTMHAIDAPGEAEDDSTPETEGDSAAVAPPPLSAPPAAPSGAEPMYMRRPRVHVYDNDRVEPATRMRQAIAENMVQARRFAAHCHTVWEIDVTSVVRARKRMEKEFAERGVKLTMTAFFVAAASDALRRFPLMNAVLDGDRVIYRGSVNVGIAAAAPEGLIVPVLKNADTLNLMGVARSVNDLASRAKSKQLRPDDVVDGTFSISNSGIFGSLFGVPILIPPQVGILNTGAAKKRVVADENDNIRIRHIVTMCLTFDHRLIDGATADSFMKRIAEVLEGWKE